jgi:hypothetical protein
MGLAVSIIRLELRNKDSLKLTASLNRIIGGTMLKDIHIYVKRLTFKVFITLVTLITLNVKEISYLVVVAVDNFFFKHVYAGEKLWITCAKLGITKNGVL